MTRVAIALLVFALVPAAAWAQGQNRIALLIGNQSYNAKVGRLKNPHKDVALVGAALKSLGFKVTEIKDAGYKAVDTAINRHIQSVRREGPDSISVVYYSGHGAANPDTKINYMIPIDVANADDEELWTNSLNLNKIVEALREQAPAAIHYIVFDACRSELNLTRKSKKALSDKGFAPIAYTPGVMVAYATAPGRTAADAGRGGGAYAKALSDEIVKPGVEAMYMFRRVALRVNREIGQDPWLSASTLPEVYFAGPPPAGAEASPRSLVQAGGFFTEQDANRVRSLADRHRLPLPDFRIEMPKTDVPVHLRRFIGVWIYETGGDATRRKAMMIVTRVEKDGKSEGYWVYSASTPGVVPQIPAGAFKIVGTVASDSLRFSDPTGTVNFKHTLTSGNRMSFSYSDDKGQTASTLFAPLWMLVEAERSAKR